MMANTEQETMKDIKNIKNIKNMENMVTILKNSFLGVLYKPNYNDDDDFSRKNVLVLHAAMILLYAVKLKKLRESPEFQVFYTEYLSDLDNTDTCKEYFDALEPQLKFTLSEHIYNKKLSELIMFFSVLMVKAQEKLDKNYEIIFSRRMLSAQLIWGGVYACITGSLIVYAVPLTSVAMVAMAFLLLTMFIIGFVLEKCANDLANKTDNIYSQLSALRINMTDLNSIISILKSSSIVEIGEINILLDSLKDKDKGDKLSSYLPLGPEDKPVKFLARTQHLFFNLPDDNKITIRDVPHELRPN